MKARIVFHGVAVLLLLTAVAVAQEPKDKAKQAPVGHSSNRESSAPSVSEREASSGMASGRKSGSIVVLDRESSQPSVSEVSPREASSGMASGRKSGAVNAADFNRSVTTARETGSGMATGRMAKPDGTNPDDGASLNAKNSAHATESISGKLSSAQSNPMYKESGNQGTNPLFESKDKMASKPAGNASPSKDVVEYKDGEDGTTRTRPGNKKTN